MQRVQKKLKPNLIFGRQSPQDGRTSVAVVAKAQAVLSDAELLRATSHASLLRNLNLSIVSLNFNTLTILHPLSARRAQTILTLLLGVQTSLWCGRRVVHGAARKPNIEQDIFHPV
jgi:hypothetical protein